LFCLLVVCTYTFVGFVVFGCGLVSVE